MISHRKHFSDPKIEYTPCENPNSAKLIAFGDPHISYEWFYDGELISTDKTYQLLDMKSGIHEIRIVRYDSACNTSYDKTEILDVPESDMDLTMPNIFTPNGDGINDIFKPRGYYPENFFSDYTLKVYNRWGAELFSSGEYKNGWNGNFTNKPMPDGVYYYLINYTDICGNSQSKSSFVHLNR